MTKLGKRNKWKCPREHVTNYVKPGGKCFCGWKAPHELPQHIESFGKRLVKKGDKTGFWEDNDDDLLEGEYTKK